MKRCFLNLFLASGVLIGVGSAISLQNTVKAQTEKGELFYTYYDRKIPLQVSPDAIAVEFKPQQKTRGIASKPPYLQLKEDLQTNDGTRSASSREYAVTSLNQRYALVKLLVTTRGESKSALQKQIEQKSYVESTAPVVKRSDRSELIVLPNEILVSFDPQLSESKVQAILKSHNLSVVRSLRFSSSSTLR